MSEKIKNLPSAAAEENISERFRIADTVYNPAHVIHCLLPE